MNTTNMKTATNSIHVSIIHNLKESRQIKNHEPRPFLIIINTFYLHLHIFKISALS
jgi:hypothetical protein